MSTNLELDGLVRLHQVLVSLEDFVNDGPVIGDPCVMREFHDVVRFLVQLEERPSGRSDLPLQLDGRVVGFHGTHLGTDQGLSVGCNKKIDHDPL